MLLGTASVRLLENIPAGKDGRAMSDENDENR